SAKFKSVAREIVRPAKETIEPTIQDIGQIAKGSIEQLERQLRNVDESKPIVLVLMIGPERRYTADALLVYIRRLTEYAKFGYVVFVREDREVVASMPVREIKRVLETPVGTDFV